MKCTHVCSAQKAYYLFTELQIKPDFRSLADELAEPRQDMNIKVAAFTVSEKSSNILVWALISFISVPIFQCSSKEYSGEMARSTIL